MPEVLAYFTRHLLPVFPSQKMQKTANLNQECISNLIWVIQDVITNLEIQNSITETFGNYELGHCPVFLDILPEDENGEPNGVFFGLLGTPNVKGVGVKE
jgi:hypothetical protein